MQMPKTVSAQQTWITVSLAIAVLVTTYVASSKRVTPSSANPGATSNVLTQLPLAFVANQGQWNIPAAFVASKGPLQTHLDPTGMTLQFVQRIEESKASEVQSTSVRLVFEGANPQVQLQGQQLQSGYYNYFLGEDPATWRTHVPAYAQVLYRGLYEGIDLRVREHDHYLEYDLLLAPGAVLEQAVIRTEGAERLSVEPDGSLVLHTPRGSISQQPPLTWQELPDGTTQPVEARFRVIDATHYGFEVPNRQLQLALVIDPGLEYSTFLGGSTVEEGTSVVRDALGNMILTGYTKSPNFPTTGGGLIGQEDAFLTSLNASGSALVYSTIFGGITDERSVSLATNASGYLAVTGFTSSADFPISAGAYDPTFNGLRDVFVSFFNPAGQLVYSTYVGGSDWDQGYAIAVDASNILTVGGETSSTSFPTTSNAYDTTRNGGTDAFVTRLDPAAVGNVQLLYSTFLGGTGTDLALALALDTTSVYVGVTGVAGAGFPTTPGAYNQTSGESFVTKWKVNSMGGLSLLYSTFIPGTPQALAMTQTLDAIIGGFVFSGTIPTTPGVYDPIYNGGTDGFLLRLNASGSALVYATYFGGSSGDEIRAVTVDSAETVTIGGLTSSTDFPTTLGSYQPTISSGTATNAFLSRLNSTASLLPYSTLLAGNKGEVISDIWLDATLAAIVGGGTSSADFPVTPSAYDPSFNSTSGGVTDNDAYISRLDLLPTGVSKYGTSTTGGTCPQFIASGVTEMPQQGASNFAVTATGAPPNTSGYLLIGQIPQPNKIPLRGVVIYIGPGAQHIVAVTNALGYAEVPVNLGAAGSIFFTQFAFPNTPACGGANTRSASNALAVTVQP